MLGSNWLTAWLAGGLRVDLNEVDLISDLERVGGTRISNPERVGGTHHPVAVYRPAREAEAIVQ